MTNGVAIVLALAAVGAAGYVLWRRTAPAVETSMCARLAAIDPRAAGACAILDVLGFDAETPAKVVGGIAAAPKAAVTGLNPFSDAPCGFGEYLTGKCEGHPR